VLNICPLPFGGGWRTKSICTASTLQETIDLTSYFVLKVRIKPDASHQLFKPIGWSFNRALMHKGRFRLHLSRPWPSDQWIKRYRMEVPAAWIDKGIMHVPWVHHCTIPYLNKTIYRRWVGGWNVSWHHRMNRRCLLCHLLGCLIRPFCFSGQPGFLIGRSRIMAFLLGYLDSNWSKVGLALTSWPCALYVLCSYISFFLCVEADTSGHGWTVRLSQPNCLLEHRTVRA
jgi:hypothetical protein